MIVEVNEDNIKDINKSNVSYKVFGKIIPEFIENEWKIKEELLDNTYEYEYPIEEDDYNDFINNYDKNIFLYYWKNECVGQIIFKKYWNENTYIQDFAVNRNYRNKGIGSLLMDKVVEWTKNRNLKGIMLETQDVNIAACRFYQKYGFILGGVDIMLYSNFRGVDTMLFSNFKDHDQKALFWYYKLKE